MIGIPYEVTQLNENEWQAKCKLWRNSNVTVVKRISHSPFDALRQLMQATGELEPLEAKIEEGEA